MSGSSPVAGSLGVTLDVSAVPSSPAGAGRYILELARGLDRRGGVDLWLVTRRDDGGRFAALAPGARLLELVPTPRPARLAYERLLLGRHLNEISAEGRVYHGPHYTMPRGLRHGRVVTVHDVTLLEHPEWHEPSKVAFFGAAIRRAARDADVLICVSRATARRLVDLVEVHADLVVAEHGVDHERFAPGPPDGSLLGADLLASELVVHVGTLEPRKGIVDLVAAFERLAPARPSLRLVLAGQLGWGAGEVRKALERSPVRHRIETLGFVADETVVSLMRAARVVAYPSHEEGFGLPALEAMAVGAPLVTTVGTAMAEFAGESAWLCGAGDPGSLSSAIAAALDAGEDERSRRRAAGLERAAAFTWERTAEVHEAAYRHAAARATDRQSLA